MLGRAWRLTYAQTSREVSRGSFSFTFYLVITKVVFAKSGIYPCEKRVSRKFAPETTWSIASTRLATTLQ
jgi:hypothetical protein